MNYHIHALILVISIKFRSSNPSKPNKQKAWQRLRKVQRPSRPWALDLGSVIGILNAAFEWVSGFIGSRVCGVYRVLSLGPGFIRSIGPGICDSHPKNCF